MKLSKLSLAAACLPAGLADFWMVYQRRNVQIGRVEETLYGTSIVSDLTDWTCEADTFSHRIVPDQRDVSGTRYGVQFEPWSSKPGPLWHEPIWIVRMNLYPSALGRQSKHTHTHTHTHTHILSLSKEQGEKGVLFRFSNRLCRD
ncbi:hypothetical protein F4802DRAFT_299060 [Xylaria palmicola]|nr:hypothetical protein F4802DRAFT_299060 [Xylaria palmicola]